LTSHLQLVIINANFITQYLGNEVCAATQSYLDKAETELGIKQKAQDLALNAFNLKKNEKVAKVGL
jgi:hypothetical protein